MYKRQVYDWTGVLNTIIEQVKGGTLGGQSFALTLENGGLVMDYNPEYQIPEAAKAAADEAAAAIAAGTISVFGEATAPAEEAEEPAAEAAPITFGVVLVGPRNDHGWSQAHADGAQFVMDNIPGSEAIIFESLNSADKPEATLEGVVDDMVAEGATLILTTSDEFEEDTLGVAQKYPEVTFINVSGDDAKTGEAPANLGNVMGLSLIHI